MGRWPHWTWSRHGRRWGNLVLRRWRGHRLGRRRNWRGLPGGHGRLPAGIAALAPGFRQRLPGLGRWLPGRRQRQPGFRLRSLRRPHRSRLVVHGEGRPKWGPGRWHWRRFLGHGRSGNYPRPQVFWLWRNRFVRLRQRLGHGVRYRIANGTFRLRHFIGQHRSALFARRLQAWPGLLEPGTSFLPPRRRLFLRGRRNRGWLLVRLAYGQVEHALQQGIQLIELLPGWMVRRRPRRNGGRHAALPLQPTSSLTSPGRKTSPKGAAPDPGTGH